MIWNRRQTYQLPFHSELQFAVRQHCYGSWKPYRYNQYDFQRRVVNWSAARQHCYKGIKTPESYNYHQYTSSPILILKSSLLWMYETVGNLQASFQISVRQHWLLRQLETLKLPSIYKQSIILLIPSYGCSATWLRCESVCKHTITFFKYVHEKLSSATLL